MRVFLKILSLTALTGVLTIFHFGTFLLPLKTSLKLRLWLLHVLSKITLRVLGISVDADIESASNIKTGEKLGTLIVSNHLSYLDPIIICSIEPSLFVTSVDMGTRFGLGHFCRIAGCLFVNRNRIWNLHQEILTIEKMLSKGVNVTFFPEATTSSGRTVLPFKSSLAQASVRANSPLRTYCIRVVEVDGDLNADTDLYSWYGEMDFIPHCLKLLRIRKLKISVKEAHAEPWTKSRKLTISQSYNAVRGTLDWTRT